MAIKILYVEDNQANTLLMRKVFRGYSKYQLLDSPSAEDGLEVMESYRPDVILMDIGLPGMSGVEMQLEIRQRFDWAKSMPIIAVSADAMPFDVQKGLDAGFFDYITKPIDFCELETVLETAVATF